MAVHCYQYQEDSRDREDRKVGALKERTPSSFSRALALQDLSFPKSAHVIAIVQLPLILQPSICLLEALPISPTALPGSSPDLPRHHAYPLSPRRIQSDLKVTQIAFVTITLHVTQNHQALISIAHHSGRPTL